MPKVENFTEKEDDFNIGEGFIKMDKFFTDNKLYYFLGINEDGLYFISTTDESVSIKSDSLKELLKTACLCIDTNQNEENEV